MAGYFHHFTGAGCEAPGCSHPHCDLYPVAGGRALVRACNAIHARQATCWWCGGLGSEAEPLHAIPTAYDAAGRPVMPMLAVHRACEAKERGE